MKDLILKSIVKVGVYLLGFEKVEKGKMMKRLVRISESITNTGLGGKC